MAEAYDATVHASGFGSNTDSSSHVRHVLKGIERFFPEETPFLALQSKLQSIAPMHNNKLEWQYKGDHPRYITVGSGHAGATTIPCTLTTAVRVDTVLFDPVSRWQGIVTTVNAGASVVVATTNGTLPTFSQGKKLRLGGLGVREGVAATTALGITPTFDHNFGQQFEEVWGTTDRVMGVQHYGYTPESEEEKDALRRYKRQIEQQMLFGFRKEIAAGASGGGTRGNYLAGGILDYITNYNSGQHIWSAGGGFTFSELNRWMTELTRFGRKRKRYGFCSSEVCRIVSEWVRDDQRTENYYLKDIGVSVTRLHGVNWTLDLVSHELFEDDDELQQWMMLVDLENAKKVTMQKNQDTVHKNITGGPKDGSHSYTHQITGIHSLAVPLPSAHGLITDINS